MHYFLLFQPLATTNKHQILKWFVVFVIFSSILIYLKITNNNHLVALFFLIATITLALYISYFLITNSKRYLFIPGKFIGKIIFTYEYIQIVNTKYSYQEIASITFFNHDYLGRYHPKNILQPSVSIGVDNKIEILFKNGDCLNYHFQMKHDHELFRVEKYLIKNKTSFKWTNNSYE